MSTPSERAAAYHRMHSPRVLDVVRTNGLAPLEPEQVAFGTHVVLAGDRDTSVAMRVAGSDESVPAAPIRVRPAYRPDPRPRLSLDELIWHSDLDPGKIVGYVVILFAVAYFTVRVLASFAR